MNVVVDTSAWIEWALNSPLASRIAPLFPPRESCVVPTLVQHELSKWLVREKGEDEADRFIAVTMMCRVVPLDTRLALLAAEIARQHRLASADSIIYATARHLEADLLTCDAHFEGLPGVTYIAKGQSA